MGRKLAGGASDPVLGLVHS